VNGKALDIGDNRLLHRHSAEKDTPAAMELTWNKRSLQWIHTQRHKFTRIGIGPFSESEDCPKGQTIKAQRQKNSSFVNGHLSSKWPLIIGK
jgi:hypothetical protein